MDDLTASYASEYERLCEEGGFAVCRLDLRGTGSSEGIALDEYHAQEQADICAVIAWLAEQDWCTGKVGMYGTSWGGFNSIQVAMERPPALHAIVPIYASDDRYTDDVHYMGGILKAIDLVDWVIYMAACNVLPPVPAVYGDGWREEWLRRIEGTEPWLLRWLEEQDDGPYWRHGSLRPRLRADHVPDDDRRGLGRRLHEHRVARLRGDDLSAARDHRAVGARVHGDVDPRPAHRPRARADPLVLALATRRAERHRRGAAARGLRAAVDASGAGPPGDARRVALGADVAGGAPPPDRMATRR